MGVGECAGCICPAVVMPVCCEGTQYSNACGAACDGKSGCDDGPCISSTVDDGCTCPEIYNPFCCESVDFGNECIAACQGYDATRDCDVGECIGNPSSVSSIGPFAGVLALSLFGIFML